MVNTIDMELATLNVFVSILTVVYIVFKSTFKYKVNKRIAQLQLVQNDLLPTLFWFPTLFYAFMDFFQPGLCRELRRARFFVTFVSKQFALKVWRHFVTGLAYFAV